MPRNLIVQKTIRKRFFGSAKTSVLDNKFKQKEHPSAQKMQLGFSIPMMFEFWLQMLLFGCQSRKKPVIANQKNQKKKLSD